MKIIYGIKKIKRFKKPVVALGVFDGMHCGHRRILEDAARYARLIKGTSVVVTFWPHPQKENNIYSLQHRLRLISQVGIDVCIIVNFNKSFSGILAEDFVKKILIDNIGAHSVYIGKNFKFGKNAKGDYLTMTKLSHLYNFKIKVFDVFKIKRKPVSSTYIRRLITRGDLRSAQCLLARPVSVLGTVVKGVSLGRHLGFPTANIDPHHEVTPPFGVYAVKVLLDNRTLNGVCYIGRRPTFKSQRLKNIEVYIFNFNKNIYERYLEIQFIKRIRKEKRFSSARFLIQQIRKDISAASKVLPPF